MNKRVINTPGKSQLGKSPGSMTSGIGLAGEAGWGLVIGVNEGSGEVVSSGSGNVFASDVDVGSTVRVADGVAVEVGVWVGVVVGGSTSAAWIK